MFREYEVQEKRKRILIYSLLVLTDVLKRENISVTLVHSPSSNCNQVIKVTRKLAASYIDHFPVLWGLKTRQILIKVGL